MLPAHGWQKLECCPLFSADHPRVWRRLTWHVTRVSFPGSRNKKALYLLSHTDYSSHFPYFSLKKPHCGCFLATIQAEKYIFALI